MITTLQVRIISTRNQYLQKTKVYTLEYKVGDTSIICVIAILLDIIMLMTMRTDI